MEDSLERPSKKKTFYKSKQTFSSKSKKTFRHQKTFSASKKLYCRKMLTFPRSGIAPAIKKNCSPIKKNWGSEPLRIYYYLQSLSFIHPLQALQATFHRHPKKGKHQKIESQKTLNCVAVAIQVAIAVAAVLLVILAIILLVRVVVLVVVIVKIVAHKLRGGREFRIRPRACSVKKKGGSRGGAAPPAGGVGGEVCDSCQCSHMSNTPMHDVHMFSVLVRTQ